MAQANLDSGVKERFLALTERLREATSKEKLDLWYATPQSEENPDGPYNWQCRFHEAGAYATERCAMAGNRTGKTRTASAEVACHLTGLYPDWWKGRRFDPRRDGAIEGWVGSETNEASRDIVQKALLGGLNDQLGTGMIPARMLEGQSPKMRQCGIQDVVDTIKVKHVSGMLSTLGFKTYEQGRKRWQGTSKHFVWFDEEPPADIYAEGQTRTLDKNGLCLLTFTPLKGVGDVVYKFMNCGHLDGVWMVNASWDDAPHLSDEAKAQMLESYPEHEREARIKGLPTMGSGIIFPFGNEQLRCDPFEIPKHWKRVCGIDFGINHPAAAAWLAIDTDTDTVYVTDCYKQAGEAAAYHASRINAHADSSWIPVAWPHDGMNKEKSGGQTLAEYYRENHVRMMPISARHDDDKGGAQPLEPGLMEMFEYMKNGRFKVFCHLGEWFEEKGLYHRDDRLKVVQVRDDIMSATRYAMMMRRYAISKVQAGLMANPLTHAEDVDYDPLAAYDRR